MIPSDRSLQALRRAWQIEITYLEERRAGGSGEVLARDTFSGVHGRLGRDERTEGPSTGP